MKPNILYLYLAALVTAATLLASTACGSDGRIDIRNSYSPDDTVAIWIFFNDKGAGEIPLAKLAPVSDKAVTRRLMRGVVSGSKATHLDRQVNETYINQLQPHILKLRHKSRWLNAISAEVRYQDIETLLELDFVNRIKEIAIYKRKPIRGQEESYFHKPGQSAQFDYGSSFGQLDQIRVVDLHESGFSGSGVTILMLDTGFKTDHPAFAEMDIDSTWDFINGDVDVVDDDSNLSQQSHGTATLSVIGGFAEGHLIGAAFNATYLLAKTEQVDVEIQAEEDDWVAGIEWGEAQGADIVSSSLAYSDWYSWEDMDGNTAVTTIAADIAAGLGVIVVNSIGNDGHTAGVPTLYAPSDGDSVIAVGAVDANGVIAGFSSNGPTFDDRIKPDILAKGASVFVARPSGIYTTSSGTSFSCPLIAGTIALLLEAHPEWQYGDIYDALTTTASRASSPDFVYGYGLINALAALGEDSVETTELIAYPNPFSQSILFKFPLKDVGFATLRIYTVAGEEVVASEKKFFNTSVARIRWDGKNADGEAVAAGVYIAYLTAPGVDEVVKIVKIPE